MVWDKPQILKTLKQLHKDGEDISYNSLSHKMQPLVSAAAYHFGSYRDAVAKAGVDYSTVLRRPRWTKAAIIKLIKDAKRDGQDLHWSAVTKRRDELGKAAFASIQSRLFGSWDRALTGAGLDADEVNRYRKWNKETITSELRQRSRDKEPLNSGTIQAGEPGLHAAAVRHFGSYDAALRAANLDPEKFRRRIAWSKERVKAELKKHNKDGGHMSDSAIRRDFPALYGAAIRLFGSFTAARVAAGVKWKRAS